LRLRRRRVAGRTPTGCRRLGHATTDELEEEE
jgi:hypothetical protein